jgi:hypothetical protein
VFVGCQIFVLEISRRRVASAPYLPDKATGTRFQDDALLPKRDYLVSSVKIGRGTRLPTYVIREPIISQSIDVFLRHWIVLS